MQQRHQALQQQFVQPQRSNQSPFVTAPAPTPKVTPEPPPIVHVAPPIEPVVNDISDPLVRLVNDGKNYYQVRLSNAIPNYINTNTTVTMALLCEPAALGFDFHFSCA